jgi:translocation and assembly module TamB
LMGRMAPEHADVELMLESRDLQDLHPDASGTLDVTAAFQGAVDMPVVSVELAGGEIEWLGHTLEKIAGDVQLDLSHPQHPSRIALEVSGLRAQDTLLIDNMTLTAAGTRAQHRVQLAGARTDAEWNLTVQGGLDDNLHWGGRLEDALLGLNGEPLWQLRGAAIVTADARHARLAESCLDAEVFGQICVAAHWHADDGWQASLGLDHLDLHTLGEWLSLDFVAQGRLVGRVAARGDAAGFDHLAGDVELSAGSLAPSGFPDEPLVAWQHSTITLVGDSSQAAVEARVDVGEHGALEGQLRISWNDEDPALDGRITVQLAQPELATIFVPELARVEGRLGAAVDIGGTLSEPSLGGELYWENGAASMPTFGARAHDIELRGTFSDHYLQYTAAARAGDGELRSEGRFTLPPEPLVGEVRLWGTDALVVNLPGTQVHADPELTLTYREDQVTVQGDVRIPYGRITALSESELPTHVVQLSPDEVIVGAEGAAIERAEWPQWRVDIRLLIGPDFLVDVEGVAGAIEGDVRVIQEPDAEVMARGHVNIQEGSFTLFEQPLIIGEGRLLYSDSPIENPALDIRAELTTEDVKVGAIIRGSLIEPEVSLLSDPPMPEAEVLSYMITGRGLHDLRIDEADIVHSAANSIMMAAADLLGRQVGTRLGFDAIGATGGAQPGSADLVIGLHLGSRLFVSYGVGLYEAISAMRLRYRLGRRWALEVVSGDVSSADVMATMER